MITCVIVATLLPRFDFCGIGLLVHRVPAIASLPVAPLRFCYRQTRLPTVIEGLDILPLQYISEDQALGRLPEERFLMLAAKYDDEQAALRQRIRYLKKIVREEKEHELNADGFLALVRQHTADFRELTPEMVGEFIDKIVVHHREKEQGLMQQRVEIYYKMVGHVNVPSLDKTQTERLQVSFGRIRDVVAVAA